jgi:hypothetical protein
MASVNPSRHGRRGAQCHSVALCGVTVCERRLTTIYYRARSPPPRLFQENLPGQRFFIECRRFGDCRPGPDTIRVRGMLLLATMGSK